MKWFPHLPSPQVLRVAAILALGAGAGTTHAAVMTFTEVASGTNSWNDPSNWSTAIPTGADDAVISAGDTARATGATPSYSGSLNMLASSTLRVDSGGSQNAFIGAFNIIMNSGANLANNSGVNLAVPDITLLGDATFSTPFGSSDHNSSTFGSISGVGTHEFSINGFNNHHFVLSNANTFTGLNLDAIDRHRVSADAAGSLGLGDVTITPRGDGRSAVLVLNAAGAFARTATFSIDADPAGGLGWDGSGGGALAGTSYAAQINVDNIVGAFFVDGVDQGVGTFNSLTHPGILGGSFNLIVLPEPSRAVLLGFGALVLLARRRR